MQIYGNMKNEVYMTLNSIIKVFRVLYLDNNEFVDYSVDCELEGYEEINLERPLVKKIIEMRENEESSFGESKFRLIYKSDNLASEKDKKIKLLIKILEKYNDVGFIHETSISNLRSMYYEKRMYSRNNLKKNKIKFKDIAEVGVLKRTDEKIKDCVRFYLKKNAPAMYNFKGKTCILVCPYSILYEKHLRFYMTNSIASSKPKMYNINCETELDELFKSFNFEKVYDNKYYENSEILETRRKYNSSEFLINEGLPIKYISKIIFKNYDDKIEFEKQFPNWNIEKIVDSSFFKKKGI